METQIQIKPHSLIVMGVFLEAPGEGEQAPTHDKSWTTYIARPMRICMGMNDNGIAVTQEVQDYGPLAFQELWACIPDSSCRIHEIVPAAGPHNFIGSDSSFLAWSVE